ncbi:DUF4168 domain-containing protein [Nitrincola alkalilacustris]|uniref:DUF4168 domain-containing protein n=1 Tax=Nitrincola alkalilacustris TaxID=1571224 RepID=UPI0014575A2A|nr:DUF4168 domain-containing protein [Nitrincola alkalilacustris]
MKRFTKLVIASILAGGIGAATITHAQGTAPQAGGMAQQGAVTFDDTQLQTFVSVQPVLDGIRSEYAQRLETASDADAAAALQEEAGLEMVSAVQEAGLDVNTYNQIAMTMQQDPELRERVESMMN